MKNCLALTRNGGRSLSEKDAYREMFESAKRGILLANGNSGEITAINPFALELFDCPAAQILGKSLFTLPLFEKLPDAPSFLQRLKHMDWLWCGDVALNSSTAGRTIVEITLHSYLVSTKRTIECDLNPVAHRKQREMRSRRAHSMTALAGMAGKLGAELNGLLPVLTACSDLALNTSGRAQPSYKTLEEVQRARSRVAALARDLLAFSGKQTLYCQAVNLNDLVAGIEETISRKLSPDLGLVRADASQIQHAIATLVANVRRVTGDYGSLKLSTSAVGPTHRALKALGAAPGDYVRLSVAVKGAVLDERAWSHLFEPFYGVSTEGDENGLGLATVYGIVKQSGGYVSVSSGTASGTTFSIYLPVAEAEPAKPEASVVVRRPETIVWIEEEEGLRNLIRNLLARKGYRVLEAGGEQEAGRIFAESGEADLLVASASAVGFARSMMLAYPRLKLIYISGFTDDGDEPFALLPPNAEILQKPFRLDTLLAKVRAVLDHRPMSLTQTRSL